MPPVVLERPKMSRQLWDALKSHIVRERQRKQLELEADAEVERQRKERERQQKQDSMTLSETREQVSVLEGRLNELKEEKHQVFLQLKKVLNEDEVRKRQLISQEQTSGEMFGARQMSNYSQHGMQMPTGGMFLQQVTLTRPPTAVYKGVPVTHPPQHTSHTLLPPGALKRSRSPSPPPNQSNNYKFGPFKPPPHAIHAYPHKPGPGVGALQFFPNQAMQQHQPPSQQPPFATTHHQPSTLSQGTVFTYAGSPPSRSPQGPTMREEPPKHTSMYLQHTATVPRGYVMHPPVEHASSTPPVQKFADENPKYYPPPTHSLPIRNPAHMTIHPQMSIQAPQQVITTGSITSGYPIRTQPSATSFQGRPPSPHVRKQIQIQPRITYTGSGGPPRVPYAHPLSAHIQSTSSHPNAPRFSMTSGIQRDRE